MKTMRNINLHKVIVMYIIISALTTSLMVVCNPFFENKKLLKLTLIPLVIFMVLTTIYVAMEKN